MKKLFISVGMLVFCNSYAQKVSWQKDIPSSTQDFLSNMTSTIDRQILLSGSSIQTSQTPNTKNQTQNNGYDYHILKLDQQGSKVWEKYFGGTRHDYLASSIATQEGGFLIAGTSYSNISGDKKENNIGGSDAWLIRLNENGDELWQKTLGTKSNDEASAVVQSVDMGFFVAGSFVSAQDSKVFGSKDVFVSKLDKDGKLKQTTILGGKSLDEVTDMIATPDGGAVVLVYSTSSVQSKMYDVQSIPQLGNLDGTADSRQLTIVQKDSENFGEGDYWIVKLDKNANIEWQKTYGGSGDDRPKSIVYTENSYLVSGESRSQSSGSKKENIKEGTDIWILNLDKSGNEIWQKSYNFGNRDVAMSLNEIRDGKSGDYKTKGFLLGGYTQAEEKIKSDDEKFWMLYIEANGKEEWRKYVEGDKRQREERLVSAKLQSDGSYLLAGTSADQLGEENWKIVKLGDKQLDDLVDNKDIRIYPNPVKDYCYVELGSGFGVSSFEQADIYLYDMAGKLIQKLNTKNQITKINTSKLPQGVYVVSAITGDKKMSAKIVKE